MVAACASSGDAQPRTIASLEIDVPELSSPPTVLDPVVQPNILVLLTDDQTVEQMRVLERTRTQVFDRGTTFSESFVSYPTCCPSRATMLTGQYAHNHGVRWNSLPTGGFQNFQDQETAIPVALENAGYATLHFGKYLNGYGFNQADRFVPPGWTDFKALVSPSDGQYVGFSLFDNGEIITPDGYLTDVMTEFAVDAIEREAGKRPIFLHMAYTAPHGAFGFPLGAEGRSIAEELEQQAEREGENLEIVSPVPAPRHDGLLDDEPMPRSASFDEVDVSDKPPHTSGRRSLTEDDVAEIERNYRVELESLLGVDESVQRILDTLDDLGELDDTIVIFTSDNGFYHGEHRIAFSKYVPYEESIRVPLAISGPGVSQGEVSSELVSNVDIAATVLDYAGATSLRALDGRSLRPLVEAPDTSWDRLIYLEGTAPPGPFRPVYRGVRSPRWVYFEFEVGGEELYDLEADPSQLVNLASDPAYGPITDGYSAKIEELSDCAGDTCSEIPDLEFASVFDPAT